MKKYDTKRLVTLAMMAAIAYAVVVLIGIHPMSGASFLKYEPKDVILAITGFLFGPLDALIVTLIVSFIEMVTIPATGPIGLLMNVISSASFVCVAAAIYHKNRTLKSALIGLGIGVMLMTVVMLLWNYLITPIYMGVPRSKVAEMLMPVFLPFNLVKGALNAGITLLLYKPVVQSLRKAKLVPAGSGKGTGNKKTSVYVMAFALFIIVTSVLVFLALSGKI